jgi:hypothetical protein
VSLTTRGCEWLVRSGLLLDFKYIYNKIKLDFKKIIIIYKILKKFGFLCQNNYCIERNGIQQSYSNFDSLRIELERHFKYVYVHIYVGSTKGRTILVDLYIIGF